MLEGRHGGVPVQTVSLSVPHTVPAVVPGSGPVTPSRSYSSVMNESNEPNNPLKLLAAPAVLSLEWSGVPCRG